MLRLFKSFFEFGLRKMMKENLKGGGGSMRRWW